MTLKEITEAWLKANGYGGLYNDFHCGCRLGDLMVCDEPGVGCEAGYLNESPDCDEGCDWHIQGEKPGHG